MVKFAAFVVASFALLCNVSAHMGIIQPNPRSGIIGNQLYKPCGDGNTLTKNVTTYDLDQEPVFVLHPGHGTGELIFNYFTDITVTNNTVAHPITVVPVPKPGFYNTTLDFKKAGLKAGDQVVVQAIYNGTDDGKTVPYYVCFDVKIGKGSSESDKEDSSKEGKPEEDKSEKEKSKEGSDSGSSAGTLKATMGLFIALVAVASTAF